MTDNSFYKEEFKRLMGMSELEYGNYLMDMAYSYLKEIMKLDEWSVTILTTNAIFWKWWVNQWGRREKIIYHRLEMHPSTPAAKENHSRFRRLWEETHSLEQMNCRPTKLIMEDTYNFYVHQIIEKNHA